MTNTRKPKELGSLSPWKALIPITIGFFVMGYMVYSNRDSFTEETFAYFSFSWQTVFWFFMAFVMMIGRDIGYMARFKVITKGELSWKQVFRIVMLWEFASAVTPGAVGGTSVAVIFAHKEGLTLGKSSAMVILTSFLDELYFVIVFPLILLLVSFSDVSSTIPFFGFKLNIVYLAISAYIIKLIYLLLITYGLFINSRALKKLLLSIFKWRLIRKWRYNAYVMGTELVLTSEELKKEGRPFWAKALGWTFVSWTSRFLVVNTLFIACISMAYGFYDHLLMYAKQLVMWIMMVVFPSPGGSGIEYFFKEYMDDFIPFAEVAGIAVALSLVWRIVTYYPYLLIGAFLLPLWIRSKSWSKRAN